MPTASAVRGMRGEPFPSLNICSCQLPVVLRFRERLAGM
jgi:hypothetical protein